MPRFRIIIAERHQLDLDAATPAEAHEKALNASRTLDTYLDHDVVSARRLSRVDASSDRVSSIGAGERLTLDERRRLHALVRAGFLSGAEEWEDAAGVEVFFTDRRSKHFTVEEIRTMLSAVRAAFAF